MKKLALSLAVLAAASAAAAQERPRFGIGVGVVPIDTLANVTQTIEAYVPINVTADFRLEPSLGFFTNDQREGGVDQSNVTVGLGAFYVARVAEPTDVYVGGRVKVNFVSADDGTAQEDETDWVLAAAVGGEHYLGARFSIGAEAQFGHYQNGKLTGTLAPNDNGLFSSGLAFVRFYLK